MSTVTVIAPVTVRLARPEDDSGIGELLIRSFQETYSLRMPEVVVTQRRIEELRAVRKRREGAKVWVLESNDSTLLGTVCLVPPGSPLSESWLPSHADLRMLALLPETQGQGLAGLLMDAAEEEARRRTSARGITLHVRRGAQGLERFYAKRGYVRAPEGDLNFLPEIFLHAFRLDF